MQKKFGKTVTAAVALLLAGGVGAAYAINATQDGFSTSNPQQDAAKDCKKDPTDPRCREGK
jgi:hypothetical protein